MKDDATPPVTPLYATPEGLARPLRVVLVVPPQVPGWVRAFHGLAAGHEWIEVIALVAPDAALPRVGRVAADVGMYVALEHAVHGGNASLAAVPMPLDRDDTSDQPWAARIAALRPDLVILFGPQAWAPALADHAPWGCWQVDASLTDPRHAGLSLLAPMMRGDAATRMELILQEATSPATVLTGSWGRTRAASFLIQREAAFRKLPPLLLRALHRLAAGRLPAGRHRVATLQMPSSEAIGRAAGLRALWSISRAALRSLLGWLRTGRGWSLLLRRGGTLLDPEAPAIGAHVLVQAPRGWWADPCVIAAEGRTLVFVEEMANPRTHKANIACVELVDGGARRLGIALDEPGHLSFPQVFSSQGQWQLTVESGYDRRVSLYQTASFPLGWVRVRDLVTGRLFVDPVLQHHEGHWYLFANVAETGNNTCDELFLFVAESLEGPFQPHPANPVVSDAHHARMAGRLFHHQGRLIRPAQDCALGYGKAVVFNEVLELGPKVYRERALSRLAADWAPALDGCHTYTQDGGVEVLDILGRPPAGAAYLPVSEDRGGDAATAAPGSGTAGPRLSPDAPRR